MATKCHRKEPPKAIDTAAVDVPPLTCLPADGTKERGPYSASCPRDIVSSHHAHMGFCLNKFGCFKISDGKTDHKKSESICTVDPYTEGSEGIVHISTVHLKVPK